MGSRLAEPGREEGFEVQLGAAKGKSQRAAEVAAAPFLTPQSCQSPNTRRNSSFFSSIYQMDTVSIRGHQEHQEKLKVLSMP